MDLSVRRVLEGLQAGPATPGILATRFGMGVEESHEALAFAIDEGWVRPVPPLAFELTVEGGLALAGVQGEGSVRAGLAERAVLDRRACLLRRWDP